jgi:cytochrome P450
MYQYMRTVEPVHRSAFGFWILTRYEDCRSVLEDKRWSHDADRILEPGRGETEPVDPTVRLLRNSILFNDPPRHGQHLRVLEGAVRKASKGLDLRTGQVARGLIKLMREKESGMDLIHDYASPLALVVLTDLLGIPAVDRSMVQRWSRQLAMGVDPAVRSRSVVTASAASAAFVEYLLDRLESGQVKPSTGMMAELATRPGKLKTYELIADVAAFLVIGLETVSGLIGNALHALLLNPDQLKKLRRQPTLGAGALAELIRFDGPLHLTARVANADVEIGRSHIAAGEQVIVLLGAANRDPARFKDPDRLDLARTDNAHLGFGGGIHACFAASLANLVGGTAIQELVSGLGGVELAGDPEWNNTVTVRGMKQLPVAVSR